MLKRSMWPVARPDRPILQEGSKGPSPEGACDSQPLAWGSTGQAVSMPDHVKIHSETSPIHGPPCSTPPVQAIHPSSYQWRPPPPAGNSCCEHSTLHRTTVSHGSGSPRTPHEPKGATAVQ